MAAQEIADIVRQRARRFDVAAPHRDTQLRKGQRRRADAHRGAAHLHFGQSRECRRNPFDGEPPRSRDRLVTLPLDVGHPPRRLHVGRHDARQRDRIAQRIDLLHSPQIDLAGGGRLEAQVAHRRCGRERAAQRVARHRQREGRHVDGRSVGRPARIGRPGIDRNARHGLGQRGVFEAAVAHGQRRFEGRQPVARQHAFGPCVERQLPRSGQVLEIARVEGRNQRQDVAELDFRTVDAHVHLGAVVRQRHPAVEAQSDRIEAQSVVGESETLVFQIGVERDVGRQIGVAQQRHPAGRIREAMRLQPQVEVAALARQVAAQAQVERIDTGAHSRRVVLIADDGLRQTHVAHPQTEGRRLVRLGRLLLLRRFVRRFHHVPVHAAVGEFARMQMRLVDEQFGHLVARIAEERHQVDDHRDAPDRSQRIPFERRGADDRQPLQLDRSVREMAQQTQVERTEIDFGGEQFTRLFLHDVAHLRFECERHDERDGDEHDRHDRNDFQKLFHTMEF